MDTDPDTDGQTQTRTQTETETGVEIPEARPVGFCWWDGRPGWVRKCKAVGVGIAVSEEFFLGFFFRFFSFSATPRLK